MRRFVLCAVLLAGCGSDEPGDASFVESTARASSAETASTPAHPPVSAVTTSTFDAPTVEVVADDYSFDGIPRSVPPGTRFSLTNVSAVEVHELVALRVPDGDTRPVEQLVALAPDEWEATFGSDRPALQLIAMPGSDIAVAAVGDGTIIEPGRYIAVCLVPRGADPQHYLDAALRTGETSDLADGPPHVELGMYAEFMVEG